MTKLGILALLLAPLGAIAAMGDNSPQVELATPGVGDGAIERFTVRFNQAMVPLGDPRAAGPFEVECPVAGEGRWVDQQTFVHDFATPLPGGVTCTFTIKPKLKSVSGYAIAGQTKFTVDSGGPIARAVLPSRYGREIEEDQTFLVAANLAPDPASVAAGAYCAVDGIGEKIPVDVLPAAVAGKLIADLGTDRWEMQSFLEEAGLPKALPAAEADRIKATASVVALKCRRPLPPGRDMALIWGKDIKSASGRAAGTDQRFDFTVRKPFTARLECSRVNPQAGCNPVQEAFVRFSAPIPRAQAEAIRIKLPDGKELSPALSDEDKRRATIGDVKFKAPLPAAVTAQLVLPADVADESGRKLSNAERFPLEVKFDEAPPLIKFAANFGILEAKEGGVLPVSVRNIEGALTAKQMSVEGQSLKVEGGDGEIAKWLRAIDDAASTKSDEVKRGTETVRINQTGAKPLLTPATGKPLQIGLPGAGKDFEVIGVPLTKPGFYIVEFASPKLGQALLGRAAPRYVAAGALVTNMSVHFKWGRASSLVWVTSLDTGQGVAAAEVRITDSCTGQVLAKGTTDSSGRLGVPAGLPEPETYANCENGNASPLMVSARKADDFSFTLTDWGQGIRPYDFDLPYGYSKPEQIFHTVFDRALVRQGETIHMKHIVRQPIVSGFATSPAFSGTLRLSHRGSDTKYELPLTIDTNGIGETEWTAPQGAKMGEYDIQVVYQQDGGEKTLYTSQSFKVDEYKLPTMKASVAGPKEAAVRPRTLPLDLFVGYLSGGGAANLPVELRVGYFEGFPTPSGYEAYSFGGRPLTEGVKPLNGSDETDEQSTPLPPTQTLPVTLGADGTARTTIDVPQSLDQSTNLQVEMDYQDANGEILTASHRVPIFTSGVQLGIKTDGWLMKQDDLRLRFVALDTAGKPLANQNISVELYSREILTARRRLIGGFYAYDNQMKTTKLGATCSATTDAQGLATCQMAPGVSGEVYAVATTTDANGNVARSTRSVWLVGDEDWWFGGDNGDRMDLIPEQTEYKAGETAKFQVRMPFREATALVTVEREGVLSSFVVGLSGKDPVIEVPMPGDYAPDVYVSVMAVRGRVAGWSNWGSSLARDWGLPFFSKDGGAPTATVDLAKPAYRLGIAKVKVGWEGHRLGVTVKADKPSYATRDTANIDLEVKNPDGSPAAQADVAFAAVDEALLQLAPNESWDVLSAMMGDRPLSVLTSTAQTQVVGKRHYGKKAVEAGGGGGGDLSGLNRENFQPVLLWKGKVALDAKGHARVQVPLSDALTSFKLVAIATNGAQWFGTGEASVRTAQDLTIYAGVPTLVRTGDTYGAMFTLRNGSSKPMRVTAEVALSPAIASGKPLTVDIPAGGAAPVTWNLTAPAQAGKLSWTVTAKSADGKAVDRVTVAQDVINAVPVETWAASLTRVGTTLPIAAPAGALPGFGMVEVTLADTLAPPLQGVRDYMSAYPYGCLEQRTSKAIALGDSGAWTLIAGELPAYQDGDGLLRYFPGEWPGSEALTAYMLSITAEAGLPLPDAPRAKMLDAMKAVLDGRLRHEDYGDVRFQKIAAFAALARQGAATPAMLGQLGIAPAEMPTALLADYAIALGKVPGLANGAALRAAAEQTLKTRLNYEGTRIDLSDKGASPWWLMSSDNEAAIKAVLATLGRPGWQDESGKMMVGVAMRQQRGHWGTTTANAWGAIAARKFNALYPAEAIAGVTTASFGTTSVSRSWPLALPQRMFTLPLPFQSTPLALTQAGGAAPWAFVRVKAAVPLTQPLMAGYKMTKQVSVVQGMTPGRTTRGDVIKVTITVEASAERNWVVVEDPVPAGATVIGSLGGQSQMLAAQADSGEGVSPNWTERGRDSWRAYFGWVPRGTFTVSYVMRLNSAGRFSLPSTRVEAMYSPEIRAALPNQPVVVAER
ncbi:alpha-2-macroglobulin family protein [Sphingomonas hengshuiensis]|uniref:Alpha-2-macroglobulin n=1 Tax=Sphingomonas hengshuiensis TaxID=1609977 RepID=A0A7U4JAY0_9SPHN|nr:MG2 domain-containing protein [Sphingomonas hengshuiensis]AJP73473.1 alpha-2-macroglobulin [Sphingomonas hengshuiensis]